MQCTWYLGKTAFIIIIIMIIIKAFSLLQKQNYKTASNTKFGIKFETYETS